MTGTERYVIDPTQPFPKRWRDKHGPIYVMAGPIKGYLMVRRPHCEPFVLHVRQILNAEKHHLGPFQLVEKSDAQ